MTFRHPGSLSLFRSFLLIAGAAFIAAPGAPLVAQWDAIQSPVGDRALALVSGEEGYVVLDGEGREEAVPVPEGTVLTAVVETTSGWIAAGSTYQGNVTELVLVENDGAAVSFLPGPEAAGERFRTNPVPLVARGRLAGLAWLEGDGGERNAVRAARWTGEGWDRVATVSPPEFEAQLALSGAVLADGSWVLVWAALQGGDDDIFWSRHERRGWSEPAMLHGDNEVPDIVPAVAALGAGAVAAWGSYDGSDYRLKIFRLDEFGWNDTGFRGEEGSLFPGFIGAGGTRMLYESVTPSLWTVLDLDADGSVVRRASTSRVGSFRPGVFDIPPEADVPGGVRLTWPGRGGDVLPDGPPARVERRLPWGDLP